MPLCCMSQGGRYCYRSGDLCGCCCYGVGRSLCSVDTRPAQIPSMTAPQRGFREPYRQSRDTSLVNVGAAGEGVTAVRPANRTATSHEARRGDGHMAWTTSQVTQNGNTTGGWTISGSALTTHDAVVLRPISGSSSMRIESTSVRLNPTRYSVSVRVIGSGAMAFRFAAEAMD